MIKIRPAFSGFLISLICLICLFGCAPSRTEVKKIRTNNLAKPSGSFYVPVKNVRVLSRFGKRGSWFHTGIDIRGRKGGGDKAYASRDGSVIMVGIQRGYGKMVVIKHSDGFITRYAHLKSYLVSKGQKVNVMDPVGIIGRTGRASTAHLHFEIITPKGQYVDPALFIFR